MQLLGIKYFRFVCALVALGYGANAYCFLEPLFEKGQWSGESGFEYRYFENPGAEGQTQNDLALRLQGRYENHWDDGKDSFTFVPYALLDQQDDKRTHADIREALWIHVGHNWEIHTGVTRVFWGKAEFNHVVDVINQKDLIAGDDEKLGQPLMNLSLVSKWGIFDFYWLFGFREQMFPGKDGRLRTPLVVDTSHPVYLGNASPNSVDFAFRWQKSLTDELDMALSFFSGVDRDPSFSFNFNFADPMLVPYYSHKDQVGLELEYVKDAWDFKFEGADIRSIIQNYDTAVGGVEYTFYSIFGTNVDMTGISEYMWDSRNQNSLGFLEHDLGLGARFTFNDEFDTSFTAAMLWDNRTSEKLVSLKGERRLKDNLMLKLDARIIMDRGQPAVDNTAAQILSSLASTNLVNSALISQGFVLNYLYNLIQQQGLQVLFNTEGFVPVLQELQRMSDPSRKLSILESDSYVRLELTYYF